MNFLTLTPELQLYILAILMTGCLGSSNLASHIYSRYFAQIKLSPLVIQAIVKGIICVALALMLPLFELFQTTFAWQLLSILIGLILGRVAAAIELSINRYAHYHCDKLISRSGQENYRHSQVGPSCTMHSLAPKYKESQKTHLRKLHEHYAVHENVHQNFSLLTILAIAIFEEIIFRGYLVQCCYLLPGILSKFTLLLTVIIFGISHASFGLYQIIAKTILGSLCLVAVLMCHTVLPALIIHGYLNWVAFKYQSI